MKKTMKLWALATVTVALASCSSESAYNPNAAIEQKQAQYEKEFVQQFGRIDPTNDWGFGSATNTATTRTVEKDNGIANYVSSADVPSLISQDEANAVKNALENNLYETVDGLDLTDFYIQHVYASHAMNTFEDTSDNNTEKTEDGSSKMNLLRVNGEHVNDFNASNGGGTTEIEFVEGKTADGQDNRFKIKSDARLILNSKCVFTYEESLKTSTQNKYKIVKIKGAYYVCFDYCNSVYAGDNSYDDWIIKVTAATRKGNYRVMAEDLGSIGDFDFNDVVFDVYIEGNTAHITLQAAGGQLPLYIGDESHEVHSLFGVSVDTMVNTEDGVTKAPVSFTLSGVSSVDAIRITVEGLEATYDLTAEQGGAPRKICIPSFAKWSPEYIRIDTTYPKFKNYVGDKSVQWWKIEWWN